MEHRCGHFTLTDVFIMICFFCARSGVQ